MNNGGFLHEQLVTEDIGEEIFAFVSEIYPICRYQLIRKPVDARLPGASAKRCRAEGKTIAQTLIVTTPSASDDHRKRPRSNREQTRALVVMPNACSKTVRSQSLLQLFVDFRQF